MKLSWFTFQRCLLLYCLGIVLLSAPYWLTGSVVAPYPLEIGYEHIAVENDVIRESRFSDYYNVFLPEIYANLNGERAEFLKYWTADTELGRPVYHTSGFSQIFLPSLVMSFVTRDPAVFLTLLSWFTVAAAGLWMFLLAREWSLHSLSGLLAALMTVTTPFFLYWMSFPVFIASMSWGIGVVYGIALVLRRQNLLSMGILGWMIHALLLTGYPQTIIYLVYISAGYVCWWVVNQRVADSRQTVRTLGLLVGACAIGGLSAAPLYADMYALSLESQRQAAGYAFFAGGASPLKGLRGVMVLIARLAQPEFYGNVTDVTYPFRHSETAVTTAVSVLAYVGVFARWRRTQFWAGVACALIAMSCVPGAFRFAYDHLGFAISRSTPLDMLKIPYLLCAMCGVDALLRTADRRTLAVPLVVACALGFLQIAAAVYIGQIRDYELQYAAVALAIAMVVGVAIQYRRYSVSLLFAIVVMTVSRIDFPVMLRYAPEQTLPHSQLLEKINRVLPDDGVIAQVPSNFRAIMTNYNMRVDIASVHSINSLSPLRYAQLIERLGGQVQIYGRNNYSVNPDFRSAMWWMSNVSLVITVAPITNPALMLVESYKEPTTGRVFSLYRNAERMGKAIVVPNTMDTTGSALDIGDPRALDPQVPVTLRDTDDELTYRVATVRPSLLIVSQKYHRFWIAEGLVAGHWEPIPVVAVNDVFLGARIPAGTTEVRLAFRPYIRWMYLVLCGWMVFLLWCCYRWLRPGLAVLRYRMASPRKVQV